MSILKYFKIFIAVLVLAMASSGCLFKHDKTYRYLIPDGYIGWVRIDFKIKTAPPLPKEDGYLLIKIPPSGILKTSDDLIHTVKFQQTEYYFYTETTRYPLDIQKKLGGGGTIGKLGEDGTYTDISLRFWVGTQKEYEKYGSVGDDVTYGPVNKNQ